MKSQHGSVLVGVLWCVAVVSMAVMGILHSTHTDLVTSKNYGASIQARYLALAGVEKAKALLYLDAQERRRSHTSHSGQLADSPNDFRSNQLGRGTFRVIRQGARHERSGLHFGVSEEEGRLNINTASAEELAKLQGMTPELIASILDWRDADNNVTLNGAEAEFYATQMPPYLPRNGPFQSIAELLMVRGFTRQALLGEDHNQNGILDSEEDDGNRSYPPDNSDGVLDAGWSDFLTYSSAVRDENAAGEERVNITSADEKTLTGVTGISTDIAKAIISSRGRKQFESVLDLLDVTAEVRTNAPAGPKLISETLLMEIADDLTINTQRQIPGLININSASATVLGCLQGLDEVLAQSIVSYRQSAGFFPNIASLLKVPGMNRTILKQISNRIGTRSDTFCILAEGKVESSGVVKRLQVVVRLGKSNIETISYREDL